MKFEITPESQAQFASALRLIALHSNRSMSSLLRQLAVFAAQTARKLTPKGKANRKVFRNNAIERKMFAGKPFRISIWNNGKPYPTGIDDRNDPLRKIKYAGAAKGSWTGILKKLNSSDAGSEDAVLAGVMARGSIVTSDTSGNKPWFMLVNRLKYISKLVPDIENQAILSAENRIIAGHLAKLGAELDQIWAG